MRGFSAVRDFYNTHPFPDYRAEKYEFREDLTRQANPYSLLLDANIPARADIVDIGCGTGQLTCLLGLKQERSVLGIDFSDASLARAGELAGRLGISNVSFERVDITRVESGGRRFDFILCNGVFPCLPGGREVFERICRSFAKPGSVIVLGLYHRWGRSVFRMKRELGRIAPRLSRSALDRMMMKEDDDDRKFDSWAADQLHPPVEVCHSAFQIRRWFSDCGVDWLRSIPSLPSAPAERPLFAEPRRLGSAWSWILRELTWTWSLRWTGGYFVVMGRKGPE
jgi:SAM-dependent methyltransferase